MDNSITVCKATLLHVCLHDQNQRYKGGSNLTPACCHHMHKYTLSYHRHPVSIHFTLGSSLSCIYRLGVLCQLTTYACIISDLYNNERGPIPDLVNDLK